MADSGVVLGVSFGVVASEQDRPVTATTQQYAHKIHILQNTYIFNRHSKMTDCQLA